MTKKALVCQGCEDGVSEACVRQAQGRRHASNGFIALQDLQDRDGSDDDTESRAAATKEETKT